MRQLSPFAAEYLKKFRNNTEIALQQVEEDILEVARLRQQAKTEKEMKMLQEAYKNGLHIREELKAFQLAGRRL